MGFKVNIPPGTGEQLALPHVRAAGCAIRLNATPTLFELLAERNTLGLLKLSSLPGEATYIARVVRQGGEVAIAVCSERDEQELEVFVPHTPARVPAALRALSAELLADPLGSVATHPIPMATRNAVALAASLLAEGIEKSELLGGQAHGAVSLREEGILMAGYLYILDRALREPDALPILDVEAERLDDNARKTCTTLWPLLHALDATITGERLVPPIGICNPPPDA